MSKTNITSYLDELRATTDTQSTEAYVAGEQIFATLAKALLRFFEITAPKASEKAKDYVSDATAHVPLSDYDRIIHVYDLVFLYFFIAAGFSLIMMAALIAIAKKNKCAGDYAAIVVRGVMGVAFTMLAVIRANEGVEITFLKSPWMEPTVVLGTIIVVIVHGVLGYVSPAPKDDGSVHGEVQMEGHQSAH